MLVVAVLSALLWAFGLISEPLSGSIYSAVLVATLSCCLGTIFKAFALTSAGSGVKPGQLLQVAILGDFLLQLVVLGGILLGMHLLGGKFSSTTSFALAYAAVVFVFPLVATVILGKQLQRQAHSSDLTASKRVRDIPSS